MSIPLSTIIELGNLGVTTLLLLEVASVKRAMKKSEAVETPTPPAIELLKGWTA